MNLSNNIDRYETPRRCIGGCGFFGTVEQRGFCSYCYKNYLKEEERRKLNESSTVSESDMAPSRCGTCSRKLGLLPFRCRCGGGFCNTHRYPEAHACKFDFKNAGKVVIEKQNPNCKADKMMTRI